MKYDNKYITYLKQQNKKIIIIIIKEPFIIILNLIQLIYKINFDKRQITILVVFFIKFHMFILLKHKTNQDIISSSSSLFFIYIY